MRSKNKKKIKISIITPTYNSEKTIKTNLKSILNQTYKEVEHIIIDGNSNDKTISIVKKYPHKKIIVKPDKGIYYAMNKGIHAASGDIIAFLNSDDFYSNNKVLSKVASIFKNNPHLDACYSDLIYTCQFDISKKIRYWKSDIFIPGSFSRGWSPPHPTFFARLSIYRRFGNFNTNYKLAADKEIMMRFLEVHRINAQYIPEVWVKMRLGGVTNKNLKNILLQNLETFKSLHKNNLPLKPIKYIFFKFVMYSKQCLKS
jgi:glycosyltransferase involved in cell wall biosynthesis